MRDFMKVKLNSVIAVGVVIVLFSWLLYSIFWVLHSFSFWWVIPTMHEVFTEVAYLSFSFGLIGRALAAALAIRLALLFIGRPQRP